MRQVPQTVTNAITLTGSTKSTARLTAYKSRTFFETVTNYAPGGSTDYPIPEAVAYVASIDKFITVVIGTNGNLLLLEEGSTTPVDPSIVADARSRPGIYGHYIFYYVDDDHVTGWQIAYFNDALEITTSFTEFSSLPQGAIYPVSINEAVIIYIDEGGIRPVFIASDGSEHECPGRFMEPTHILLDTEDEDFYKLHYAGAVKKDGVIYIYITTHYGSVKVIKYKLGSNNIDGTWSDIVIAIPEDLSTYKIGNVFTENDRIFICGSFYRNEEYNTGIKYTLLTWSDDGITFSLDRRTLVTSYDLRFQAVVCGDYIAYTSTNRYDKELAHYQVAGENCPNTIIKLNNINGSAQSGWSVDVKAGDETYLDDTNIQVGNFAKLELGVYTSSGIEWVKYHDVVISSIGKGFRDGSRTFRMQVIPDGIWHISAMTHPFYMELQGKQAKFDPMADMSNMYKMESGSGPSWVLTCDFWTDETPSSGLAWFTHAGSKSDDHWCKDITQFCDEYPVFDDSATVEVRIWGWSRAGVPSTNPNTADSTPTNTLNDDFYALLLVEDTDGNQTTVVSLLTELTSTYSNPPQTHFPEAARVGSNPVVYAMDNPGEGKKLIKAGVRVIADTGNTTYYLERMEFPDIVVTQSPIVNDKDLTSITAIPVVYEPVFTNKSSQIDWDDGRIDWKGMAYSETLNRFIVHADNDPYVLYSDDDGVTWTKADTSQPHEFRGGIDWSSSAEKFFACGDNQSYYGVICTSSDGITWTAKKTMTDTKIQMNALGYDKNANTMYVFGDTSTGPHNYMWWSTDGETWTQVELSPTTIEVIDVLYTDTYGLCVLAKYSSNRLEVLYNWATNGSYSRSLVSDNCTIQNIMGFSYLESINTFIVIDDTQFGYNEECFKQIGLTGSWTKFVFSLDLGYGHPIIIKTSADYFVILSGGYIPWIGSCIIVSQDGINWTRYEFPIVSPLQSESYQKFFAIDIAYNEIINLWVVSGNGVNDRNSQVMTFTLGGGGTSEEPATYEMVNRKKGLPQVFFSSRPYSAWNFDITTRAKYTGIYSMVGCFGLATNNKNFIVGYIKDGYYGIAQVKNDRRITLIEEVNASIVVDTDFDLHFWHRDGLFGLEVKLSTDPWAIVGSQLVYEWTELDEAMTTADDIFHVGLYEFIDPPRFRTVGYRSTQNIIPVLPLDIDPNEGDSDFINDFPSSGTVDIDGQKYTYTGKLIFSTSEPFPIGPVQLRNFYSWLSPFNRDREGGFTYQGGMAVEFTDFRWLDGGGGNAEMYQGAIIASSAGYAWLNDETQWKSWITTGNAVVLLKERSRHYSDTIPEYSATTDERVYITNGLTGIEIEIMEGEESSSELTSYFPEGTFVFLDSDDEITVSSFYAVSGEHDYSIASMLDKFCKLAGTKAVFRGDILKSESDFSGDTLEIT